MQSPNKVTMKQNYGRSMLDKLEKSRPKTAKNPIGKPTATKSYGRSKIQNPSFVSGKQFYGPPFGYKNK